MLSEKQSKIMFHLKTHESITLDEAVELIGYGIYHNAKKYVGMTLSRMVNQNHIVRIKKGVFQLPSMSNTNLQDDLLSGLINPTKNR